jgi:hypothetical protein
MINAHTLEPEFAYDETQTNDAIESGDTLVAGNVVGFLMDAWPIAVTVDAGQFHTCSHADPEDLYTGSRMKPCAIAEAAQYASDNGFDVHPLYKHLID